jgi:hypothetical protein
MVDGEIFSPESTLPSKQVRVTECILSVESSLGLSALAIGLSATGLLGGCDAERIEKAPY